MTQTSTLGNVSAGSGLAVRTGLNASCSALATESEGTSAPSNPLPNQIWTQESAKIRWRRNAANSGWEVVLNYGSTANPGATTHDTATGYKRGSELINVNNNTWWVCKNPVAGAAVWAEIGSGAGGSTNAFGTISIAGQSNVVADAAPDALTLILSGLSGVTDAANDTITLTVLYGTTSTTSCVGDDTRLSNSRAPTAHQLSHRAGGTDPIPLDLLAAPSDITSLNVSTTAHGLVPKLPNDALQFFNGAGGYSVPGGGTGGGTAFGVIASTGQPNLVAEASSDIFNLNGSSSISVTTDAATDTAVLRTIFGNIAGTAVEGNDPRLSPVTGRLAISIKDYGAVGDAVTDDTTAWLNAVAAAQARPTMDCMIYIPAGIYVLKERGVFSGGPVSIVGDGMNLSVLHWASDATSAGIICYADSAKYFHHISDMTFATESTTVTDAAILIDGSAQIVDLGSGNLNIMDRETPRFLIENVEVTGWSLWNAGVPWDNGWQSGITCVATLNGTIRNCHIFGRASSPYRRYYADTSGIAIYGSPGTGNFQNGHPVQHVVEGCTIYHYARAIYFSNHEGAFVGPNNNVLGCDYGVACISEYGHPQLQCHDNHFNCWIVGIYAVKTMQCNIHDNLCYGIQTAASGSSGITIVTCNESKVSGNIIQPFSTLLGMNGIVIDDSDYCVVSDNILSQNPSITGGMATGIWLTSTAGNCKGSNNIFSGSGYTNLILNQGTANTVT